MTAADADIVDELRASRSAGWGSQRRPSERESRAADEIEQLRAERDWCWSMIRAAWPAMPPAYTPRGLMGLMLDDESLPDTFPGLEDA